MSLPARQLETSVRALPYLPVDALEPSVYTVPTVSVAVGETVLLPEVRKAGDDTIIVADGFSCREQVRQLTEREPLHLAEVLQMALHKSKLERAERPEQRKRELLPKELSAASLHLSTVFTGRRAAHFDWWICLASPSHFDRGARGIRLGLWHLSGSPRFWGEPRRAAMRAANRG